MKKRNSEVFPLMPNQPKDLFLLFAIIFLLFWSFPAFPTQAETLSQEKNIPAEEEREKKGNIFNMIFGSAPDMPTERGLLLINAFHDENGNHVKDPGEEELRNEVVCRVDGIQYRIPAFIPALRLHENYQVECTTAESSNSFAPQAEQTELFVERRGQIFRIELPCRTVEKKDLPPS
jgi:uncharacterized protein YbaR (Trm112 family)